MRKYKIYHIPDFLYADGSVGKIGMSRSLQRRMRDNKNKSIKPFDFWEILEEYDCKFTASNREIELQKQYGYKVDRIKYIDVEARTHKLTKEERVRGGKLVMASKVGAEIRRRGTLASMKVDKTYHLGEKHHEAKLNETKVKWIRQQHSRGDVTYVRLANIFGVTAANIARIVKRETWTHI